MKTESSTEEENNKVVRDHKFYVYQWRSRNPEHFSELQKKHTFTFYHKNKDYYHGIYILKKEMLKFRNILLD